MLPGLAIHDRPVRASIHPTDPPLARRIASVIRPERRSHPMIVSVLAELDRFGAAYDPPRGGGSRDNSVSTQLSSMGVNAIEP
jgi:hypothetical protein